jgi:hypothetical protein
VRLFNGYPILAEFVLPEEQDRIRGRIVLVDRGEFTYQRFVTWEAPLDRDSEGFWGHYHEDLLLAQLDFLMRSGWNLDAIHTRFLEANVVPESII